MVSKTPKHELTSFKSKPNAWYTDKFSKKVSRIVRTFEKVILKVKKTVGFLKVTCRKSDRGVEKVVSKTPKHESAHGQCGKSSGPTRKLSDCCSWLTSLNRDRVVTNVHK